MPRVNVIIPTFNRAETILRALQSVLAQTYLDFDLWIIDDGSTDNTAEVVKPFLGEQVHYLKQFNKGVSAARNLGVQKSRGEWLAFLDSDDEWLPEKLEKQVAYSEAHPDVPLIHGEEIWIRRGKRVNPKVKHQKYGGKIFEKCLPLCLISPSASFIKRSLLQEMGLWDENFIVCEDYDLWLKITAKYPVGFIDDPLIKKYGGHDDQLSSKYKAMDFWRIKSMKNILDKGQLNCQDEDLVKKQILMKGEILINGYLKHQNFENYDVVKSWMEICR